jgi:hypothetical protein
VICELKCKPLFRFMIASLTTHLHVWQIGMGSQKTEGPASDRMFRRSQSLNFTHYLDIRCIQILRPQLDGDKSTLLGNPPYVVKVDQAVSVSPAKL